MNNLINSQKINMFSENKSYIKNIDFIWNNINSSDDTIINSCLNFIDNTYKKKIYIIELFLNSTNCLPINNIIDLQLFFKNISILNLEYELGSKNWNFLIKDNKLFVQNSISKKNTNSFFYNKFINPIKNSLKNSNIFFYYFEFKNRRFLKTKDIIFVFDLNKLHIK